MCPISLSPWLKITSPRSGQTAPNYAAWLQEPSISMTRVHKQPDYDSQKELCHCMYRYFNLIYNMKVSNRCRFIYHILRILHQHLATLFIPWKFKCLYWFRSKRQCWSTKVPTVRNSGFDITWYFRKYFKISSMISFAGMPLGKGLGKGKRMFLLSSYLRLSAYAAEMDLLCTFHLKKHKLEK